MTDTGTISPGKRWRYKVEVMACHLVARFTQQLSRRGMIWLALCLGTLGAMFDERGRKVALANLQCTFGDQFSPTARERIVRQSYQNFALTMLSLFWARRITPSNFDQWIRMEGWEEIQERITRERRGVIFMCVHQGNWEWACLAAGFLGLAPKIVTANFKNAALTDVFRKARMQSGSEVIPQKHSMLRMLKTLKRGGAIGMLADLSFARGRMASVVDAWGLKMVIPVLPAALAQRTGALLVPVITEPQPDGTCRIALHTPIEAPENANTSEIAQRYWAVFQHEITRRPELWLWPYKFFRYCPRGAKASYPFYANESGAFQKLLRQEHASPASAPHGELAPAGVPVTAT